MLLEVPNTEAAVAHWIWRRNERDCMMIVCDALLTPAGIKQTESQGHLSSQLQLGQDGPVGFGQKSIFFPLSGFNSCGYSSIASLVASDMYEAAKVVTQV